MDRFMGHEEDRERKFEQALARHLRAEAGAGADTDGSAVACPDAEVLAAFHERMLSSEEMNAVKEHVSGCSRCQEVLVHLESTDSVELQGEEEKILEMREPVLAGSAVGVFAQAAIPAAAASTKTTAPPLRAPRDISAARGGKLLRWVAPAGAIAAGFLIWAVVRDKLHEIAPAQNIQVAQQRAEEGQVGAPQAKVPPADLRSDGGDEPSRIENKKLPSSRGFGNRRPPAETQGQLADRLAKNGHGAGGVAAGMAAGRLQNEDQDQGRTDRYLRQAKPAAPLPGANRQAKNLPTTGRNGVLLSQELDEARKAPARERDALNKEKLEPGVAAASPAASAPSAPAPMSETVVVQGGAGASTESAQKKDQDAKANAIGAATEQAEVSATYARTSATLKSKMADDSKVILTPGGSVLWRLGASGLIERSTDHGLHWSAQVSGTTRELVGGSAPSDVVCWIVGRRGLILRTTDGGGHWEKLAAPGTRDLAGIRATDALHATLLDGAGRVQFVTSDGGVNWERAKE
jgi:hypothetical protein